MVKKMIKLGDIATYINGYAFKPEDRGKVGLPIIRIQDLTGNSYDLGFYDGTYPQKIEINDGDVLISWSASLGVYIWNRGKALLNQHIFKVEFDKTDIDKQYFVFAVRYKLKEMGRKTHGATMKHIVKKDFDATEIPYPPYEEQVEIATNLDKIFRIIESRNQELQLLDDLVSARFVEMFGDPFINTKNWKKEKIKDAVIVEPQNGMYKPQSDYVTDGSGTPILRIDGFYNGAVTDFSSLKRLLCDESEKKKYLLKENDIVINRVNSIEYLGKCAHISGLVEETVYESNMMRMHFDSERFDPIYVTHLLCSRFIYDQIVNHAKKAVNQASINQKDVLDFDIYQPPLELQNEFADFVRQTDKSKLALCSLHTFLTLYELHILSNNLTSEKF